MEIPEGKIHIVRVKPQRGDKAYFYARKTERVNGIPKIVWKMRLGTVDDILKHYSEKILRHIDFQPFSFGLSASFLAIAEITDFFGIVDKAAPKKMVKGALSTSQYVMAMMVGRAMGPLSKAEIGRRFSDTYLNLIWKPVHHLNTQNFANHMDRLTHNNVNEISEGFGGKLVSLGLKPSLVLWDHTNFSTNIENWGEKELPKSGNAKNKRFDKNIVGTSMVLSREEIPLYHLAYPGNENDAHLFSRCVDDVVEKIQKLWKTPKDKMTIVFDKGNNSEDNFKKVLGNCHLVGSISFDEVPDLLEVPLEQFKFIERTGSGASLKAYRTSRKLWDIDDFAVVVTHNSDTEKRQMKTWERAKEKIDAKLKELKEKFEKKEGKGRRMAVKGLTTNITQVIPKQYRSIYWWTIDGKDRTFEWKLLQDNEAKMKQKFGKSVIFTDLGKWDTVRIVKTYHSKYKVENAFRWLHDKLLIPIPPVYHNDDERVREHIFLCVMALSFVRLIKRELKGITVSDERLLEELRNLEVALVKDTRTDEVQLKVMAMSPVQATVFSQLKLDKYLNFI